MTAKEVLDTVAAMPREDWSAIQAGIADMLLRELSSAEVSEIQKALEEAEGEFARGEVLNGGEMRRHFGLQ